MKTARERDNGAPDTAIRIQRIVPPKKPNQMPNSSKTVIGHLPSQLSRVLAFRLASNMPNDIDVEAAITIVSGLVLVVTGLNVYRGRAPGAPPTRTQTPRLFLIAVGGSSVLVGVGYMVFGGEALRRLTFTLAVALPLVIGVLALLIVLSAWSTRRR
jgi:small-conductance mechanosensitive channel